MSPSGWCRPGRGSQAMRSGNFDVVSRPIARAWSTRCSTCSNICRSVYTENYGDYEDQPEIDLYQKMLRETDPTEAARADARVRKARARYPGARDLIAVVVPDRPLPLVCQGLEDQPEPLHQPGFGDDMARQIGRRAQTPMRGRRPASDPLRTDADVPLHHQPDPAGNPDPGRGGGAGLRADAPDSGRHLPGAAGLGRRQLHERGARRLPCRDRHRPPDLVQFLDFIWGFCALRFRHLDVVGQAGHLRDRHALADVAGGRGDGDGDGAGRSRSRSARSRR